jgi:multidrug efflux pump
MLGVTLFGIFLTPVFFYLIHGLSEMQLFASGAGRQIGSSGMGGLVGFTIAFLLLRLTGQSLIWQLVVGITAAVFGALLVLALQRMAGRRGRS